MSQPHMDHNELARLLDGTLSEEERGSALAHLADFDEDADVLGDAAFLLREAEEEGLSADDGAGTEAGHPYGEDRDTGRDPKVVPLRPPSTGRRGWRRAPARWLALAAVLAGVLLVPLALSRSGSRDPGDFAGLLANRGAGLPAGLEHPWPVMRGGGNVAVGNAQSAKLGALQVDLEVAAAAGQADETRLLSARIASELDNVSGSGPVAAAYSDIADRADQPAEALAAPLAEARESLAAFLDEDHFSLGAWTQAARIAAQRRDAAFFQARASRKMLNRAASLPSLDDESRATVAAIRTASEGDPPDWTTLAAQTRELLRQIAS